MFFSNIKNRSLPILEQACERYALMIYEVFRGRVAYGFQSIKYSYEDSDAPKRGIFTATFIPFTGVETDCKATCVTFAIESKSHEDEERQDFWWEFSDCKVEGLDFLDFPSKNPTPVRFKENCMVVIGTYCELSCETLYTIGCGPYSNEVCNEEELKSKHKISDILMVD